MNNFSFSQSIFKILRHTQKNQGLFGKGLKEMAFENILGKGENGGCQYFLFFPHNIFFCIKGT